MALNAGKMSVSEEEEEDVEALRLAALRTLHTRKMVSVPHVSVPHASVTQSPVPVILPAVTFAVQGVFRVPPPPPPRRGMVTRGHIMHSKRNLNGIPPNLGGPFRRHRTNSNLISIVPISDEPSPPNCEVSKRVVLPQDEVPKLVLPQDRYCKTPDVGTKSKTSVPTKFSRYEDSDSDSSAESDEENDSNRSRKRRRKELDSGGGSREVATDDKVVPISDEMQTSNVSPNTKLSIGKESSTKTVECVPPLNSGCATVCVTHEGKPVDELEVSLETLMQQLNEAIGDGPSSGKAALVEGRPNPHIATSTVIVSPSPAVSSTRFLVKCQEPTATSIQYEPNSCFQKDDNVSILKQGVSSTRSEKVPQLTNSVEVNVSASLNDTLLGNGCQYASHSRTYQTTSPNIKPQFSPGRPRSPQYSRPQSPNNETSPKQAKLLSQSPPQDLSPLSGTRYQESKLRTTLSPKFRQISPKRSLSPSIRKLSPSSQRFSPTPELKRATSPRRSVSPRLTKSPRRYSPVGQRSLSPRRYSSPVRRISRSPRKQHSLSPPMHCSRSPRRHHSPSPIGMRISSSPNRRSTQSPRRHRQISPQSPRRQLSPVCRQYSSVHGQRSPPQRHTLMRRQHSSSPCNNSLSPGRLRSPSHRQRFLSPRRQRSSSPIRSFSPSSHKKRSVSPLHRLSPSPRRLRSPLHRLNSCSLSPRRRNSHSPLHRFNSCSLSPRRRNSHSPSPRRRNSRSPSPRRRNSRSPSPRRRNSRSSPPRRLNPRSPSPRRLNSCSPSPRRLNSRSPSPRRHNSRSPSTRRHNSRSPSPRRLKSRSPPTRRLNSRSSSPHQVNSQSPSSHRQQSPFSSHSLLSPPHRHTASPRRLQSPSPRRPCLPSPSRQRSPSPFRERSRSQSPCRDCSRSPCRKHSPFPRKRSTSPCRLHSPLLRKQQSPVLRRKQSSPLQRQLSPPSFRKRLNSPQRAPSPLLSKNREFGINQQPPPSNTLSSSVPSKLSPLLQRHSPSPPPPPPPPPLVASPVRRSLPTKRWSSRSPPSSPGRQKLTFESRSPVGNKFSPKRRLSPSPIVNSSMSPVKEQVPEKTKSPHNRKCSSSPNTKIRNDSPYTKRRKHSRSPIRDKKKARRQVRSKDRDDRQFKVQKQKSDEREKTSRRCSMSSDSKSSDHSSSLSLSPSPERNDMPTSPIRVVNIKYQGINHRPLINKGLLRSRTGTVKELEKKPHRREREVFDLNKKLTKRSSTSRSPSSKTSEANLDNKHQPKSGSRRHHLSSTKLKPGDEVDPVVEARKRKFESSCAIDPNKKKIRLKNKTEEKENIHETIKEDAKKIKISSPKQVAKCVGDPSHPSQEIVNPGRKVEKSDWDDIEEMDDAIQELEKAVNLWSSDESDFECRSTHVVPEDAIMNNPNPDVDGNGKKTDEIARERDENCVQDVERAEKRDRSKLKKDETRGNRQDHKDQKHGSRSGGSVQTQSPDAEDRNASSEQDLRAELSRRRAERLTKAGSVHESLPARLVQSAFQSVVGSKALKKLEREDEERRRKMEALKAERSEKPRRVTLLKKTDVEDDVSYFNITFSKGSKHMERSPSPLPVKVPVQLRLGIPVAASNSRRRRDKGPSSTRKRSRRKSKRNAMLSGIEQV